MSELQTMLADMVERLFNSLDGQSDPWTQIDEFGLARLMLPENLNGFDGGWRDARIIFELIGKYSVSLPIGESIIASKYLYDADPTIDPRQFSERMGIGYCRNGAIDETAQTFSGSIEHALSSTGDGVDKILVEVELNNQSQLLLLDPTQGEHNLSFNHATIHFRANSGLDRPNLLCAGALLKASQISGALLKTLDLSIRYVNERSQFGRPLAKFQVIQHDLARLAEQAAAVQCASQAACDASDFDAARFEIAAAKLRANMAIPEATSIAHQVHGAIGFTDEHDLHLYTNALTVWREQFGNDRYWSAILGSAVLEKRDSSIWHFVTSRADTILENKQ